LFSTNLSQRLPIPALLCCLVITILPKAQPASALKAVAEADSKRAPSTFSNSGRDLTILSIGHYYDEMENRVTLARLNGCGSIPSYRKRTDIDSSATPAFSTARNLPVLVATYLIRI
jgi:hypothetical protein